MGNRSVVTTRDAGLDQQRTGFARGAGSRLSSGIASGNEQIRQALALRYRVFTQEMGARIVAPDGLDCDDFDAYCEHLIVLDDECGQVIGTYRILPPERNG